MRKGQSVLGYKSIYFIVALFFLTFIFLYVHSAYASYQAGKVECIDKAVQENMIAKVLYSSCFTYTDPNTQQTIPGTIDLTKFTNENLDHCFLYISNKIHLTLDTQSIGDELYSPYTVNKTVWVYDSNEPQLEDIEFTFEEPAC